MSKNHIFECPHCGGTIEVNPNDIHCTIFRHGIYKNGNPLPPHSSKEVCEEAVRLNKIYGCGKPFTFNGSKVNKCDYI